MILFDFKKIFIKKIDNLFTSIFTSFYINMLNKYLLYSIVMLISSLFVLFSNENESNNLIIEQNRFNELLKCNIYYYSFMNYIIDIPKYFKNNDFNFEICYDYWSVDKIDLYNTRLLTSYNGQLLQPMKYLEKEHNCSIHIKNHYIRDEMITYKNIVKAKRNIIEEIATLKIIIESAKKDDDAKVLISKTAVEELNKCEYKVKNEQTGGCRSASTICCDEAERQQRERLSLAYKATEKAKSIVETTTNIARESTEYLNKMKHKHADSVKNLNDLTIAVEKAVKAKSIASYQTYEVCKTIYSIIYENKRDYIFFPNLKRTIDFILEIIEYLEKEPNWSIDIKYNHEKNVYLINSTNGLLEILKYFEKEHNWSIYIKNDKGNNVYTLSSYGNQLEIQHKHNY